MLTCIIEPFKSLSVWCLENLQVLKYYDISASTFFAYCINLKMFKTTSLTQILFHFYDKDNWNETISTRLDTDWKEIDNILCDQKFSKLEKFILATRFDRELFESQANYRVLLPKLKVHTMLKNVLPNFYKRNLIYLKRYSIGRYYHITLICYYLLFVLVEVKEYHVNSMSDQELESIRKNIEDKK